MSRKLENLKPERVFYYFEELSKIPRESANEKAVSNFLVDTAKKLGLEVYQDKINNIIILLLKSLQLRDMKIQME